jgi:hypothetical protein
MSSIGALALPRRPRLPAAGDGEPRFAPLDEVQIDARAGDAP